MDLTPEQKRRVDGVAQKHEATLQEYRKQGFTWSSVTPAQVEFEQRLTSALMLQQNLAAEAHGREWFEIVGSRSNNTINVKTAVAQGRGSDGPDYQAVLIKDYF